MSGNCRKCRAPLDREEPPVVEAPPAPEPAHDVEGPGLQVANAIRALRQQYGLSQRQLAMRMNVPRTYVSKIENEKATPTLSSLERLATALKVTVPDLLKGGAGHHEAVRELLDDPFIAELVPYLHTLTGLQWQSVLAQVRDMTLHTRRSA